METRSGGRRLFSRNQGYQRKNHPGKTKASRFEVNLPPGVYEHRIGVFNKFGRLTVFSEWASFEVIVSRAPLISPDSSVKILKKNWDLP